MSVIKQNGFVRIAGASPAAVMQTPMRSRSINNGEKKPDKSTESKNRVLTEQEIENQRLFDSQRAEIEREKTECLQECDRILTDAQEQARKIIEDAKAQAQALLSETQGKCDELSKAAQESGYADGFAKGESHGYEAGFKKAQDECAETLNEIISALGRLPDEKERIFKECENKLFDLIFSISNKITIGSLAQKDKAVISKMLREAAKNFRSSSYIKVSLSKLDIQESVNVDLEDLARIFKENQHIEFEILKDAPKGTLILDNGSEITDAGIQTQLKMIENLGKGKFKNKDPETEV